ncbi:hypothetical protein BGX34_003747 [Mortierella sp. NVP85]|nr:hypothetical protein BGX34_003747 [Mortierella sp. NVP85]
MVFTAITPLAVAYFLYLFTYNETPLDTLVHQIPLVLKLLQDNTTSITTIQQFHHQQYLLPGPHVTTTSALSPLNSMPAGSTSMSATLSKSTALECYYGSSSSNNFSPPYHLPPCEGNPTTLTLSPAMNGLVALVALLDDYGYDHPNKVIPGYQYLINLLQPVHAGLSPIIAYVAWDRMLAWMASLLHFWMAMEVLFYVQFWTRLGQSQKVDRVPKGPRNRQERKELFRKCIETIGKGPKAKRWAETWFDTGKTSQKAKFEDIGRSNMMQW